MLTVDRVVTETERKRGVRDFLYSLDFNERCPNVQYLINFLSTVKQKSPEGFARIQYVEQPTARDLDTHRQNVMFAAAKLKPIVIDESLTGLHALMLSREMGYTGAALKACKGQSNMMILAPVMEKNKMFLCVQDLTCPGGLTDSIGEPGCSRAWREGDRSQCAAICAGCEQRLGKTLPGHFSRNRRHDGYLWIEWSGDWRRGPGAGDGSVAVRIEARKDCDGRVLLKGKGHPNHAFKADVYAAFFGCRTHGCLKAR